MAAVPRPLVRSGETLPANIGVSRARTAAERVADAFLAPNFERSDGRTTSHVDSNTLAAYFSSVWRGSSARLPSILAHVQERPAFWIKVEGMVRNQIQGLTHFLDGLVVYVLSREWHDMFSIYIFRLHPVPHCSEEAGVRSGFFGLLRMYMRHEAAGQEEVAPTCIQEADARQQFLCVLYLLVIAAAADGASKRFLPPPLAAVITSIAGTTVGWAAGDAAVRLLVESTPAEGADAAVYGDGDEVLFALGTTGVAVLAMLLLEPFTVYALSALADRAAEKCCGARLGDTGAAGVVHRLVDWVEEALLAVTHLSGRAVTMVVLMIWTYVSQLKLLDGLSPEQRGGPLQLRLQLLWSISLTLLAALITEQIVLWRQHLEGLQQKHDLEDEEELMRSRSASPESVPGSSPPCSRSGTPVPSSGPPPSPPRSPPTVMFQGIAAMPAAAPTVTASPQRAAADVADGSSAPSGCDCGVCVEQILIWRDMAARTVLEAVRRVLSLAEQLCFFATGWSWTYVFFPLSSHASLAAVGKNGALALSLTSLAVVLIVLLPGEKLGKNRSGRITIDNGLGSAGTHGGGSESVRMSIVKQTLTSSSTFFVGWAWVVFFRDLAAVSGQTALNVHHAALSDAPHTVGSLLTSDAVEAQKRDSLIAFAGALGGVLFFGPILSVGVLWLKSQLLAQFATLGAAAAATPHSTMTDVLRLQRATVRAKLARLGMIESRPRGAGGDDLSFYEDSLGPAFPRANTAPAAHRWTIGHASLPPEAELLRS